MRIITPLVLLFVLSMMTIGALMVDESEYNLYDITSKLNWSNVSNTNVEEIKMNVTEYTNLNISEINIVHIRNILYKSIDTMGYISFEVAKWGIEFGYNHPEYDYKTFIWLLLGFFILTNLYSLFLLVALVCLIIKGIVWLIKKLGGKNNGRNIS